MSDNPEAPDYVIVRHVESPPVEPHALLVTALARAQAAFPELKKTKTAEVRSSKGNYQYNYADLADVLAAVRPALAEHGLALIQRTNYDQHGKLMLTTELHHAGGAHVQSVVVIEQSPANAQQFGGALTYMRRYELVTLLGVQADEDLDAQQVETAGPQRSSAPAPAPLPTWAAPASDARKREWRDVLEPLLGRDRALDFGRTLADSWGTMPDGAVAIAKQLVVLLHTELGDDLHLVAAAAAERRMNEAAQAVAGEVPDPASPAEQPDAPAPEEPAAGEEPPQTLDDVLTAEQPQAATVPVPELGDNEDHNRELFRNAGCTCPDPLAEPHEGTCPMIGHGIPF